MQISITLHADPGYLWVNTHGTGHKCTEDWCDCAAHRYGNVCNHRRLVAHFGGYSELVKVLRKEERKAKKILPRSEVAGRAG